MHEIYVFVTTLLTLFIMDFTEMIISTQIFMQESMKINILKSNTITSYFEKGNLLRCLSNILHNLQSN